MADVNARREARRRRILENSGNRLRKITGRNDPDENKDDSLEIKDDGFKAESNLDQYIRNGSYINSEAELQDHARISNNEHESFLSNNDRNTCLSEPVSKTELMLCTLLFNRINLILLAGIVNILLVLKLDNLFGQAIIIPYWSLMLGRFYRCKEFHEIQNGSLLIAALILCNIKPKLIYRFKVSLTLFNLILTDFCLYMFSFVLMRYVIISYYYHYIETLVNE
ncbi:uncharacterized protein TFAM isoform X3 [Linepithema humile]|uniref:uncharacterized protein TFAM isoform X3 n=1 Tax=Linepithema humile TaxID=83485 RepID=UPI0006238FE9|nr:PREDICTED: uncharacterized protein LOC105670325 [Linepithema humile]XP_012219216.1 PREDICTED: uncharacterized protein LOC105670325 [Linepithema humile]